MPKVSEAYKEEKIRNLVQAAKKVFIKKGYVQTSMQDIMDEAGISRGAMYRYFNNLEHVFLEVLREDDQKDVAFFEVSNDEQIWPQIQRWLEMQQQVIENINQSLLQAKAEFFLTSQQHKDDFSYVSQRYDEITEAIEEVLMLGEQKKEFQLQQSPERISRYMISFLNGLMLDTFQLGMKQTKVQEQLSILCFTLEKLLYKE
ncbi:TetR family transcriptional regulator [Oceanobacillus oncorhynchi subsp. incaldanensis]|uniref:TetR family transcriptional regulator n=2 Tax=Oceanobacillus TaxID=182709 RepID=A0ABV9JXS1_9BACI|nr:TetR family transcriptional regulator [Oceanobacillus oncorhynchi]MDM8100738.1 TetR family transcriptional regulator [Oceanobacillus oncorhynchi]UUI41404.1 TetR family transcriptional regulator [Oceanobacillus oncorhynchi]GIO17452.1 TetR family transcriptional regulator [Oceanobacillus oncorhynchi subsp. incaldanensis]CEI82835.1 putative HTH-type transcriptional regulator YfiR [Oceanobacillus oncorhynchi]